MLSAGAGEAFERAAALRIELRDLLGEMTERGVAVLVDERGHLGGRAPVHVLVPVEDRGVVVSLAVTAPLEDALLVQSGQNRHVRRVRAVLRAIRIERL